MTIKKTRMKLARALRKATGLKLPRAMAAAKALLGNGNRLLTELPEFNALAKNCAPECPCSPEGQLEGPKGKLTARELRALNFEYLLGMQ